MHGSDVKMQPAHGSIHARSKRLQMPADMSEDQLKISRDFGYDSMDIITVDGCLPSLNPSLQNVHESEPMETFEDAFSNMNLQSLPQSRTDDSGMFSTEQCTSDNQFSDNPICNQSLETLQATQEDLRRNQCSNRNASFQLYAACRRRAVMQCIVKLFEENLDGDNKLHLSIIHGDENASLFIINNVPEFDWLNFPNLMGQTPLHLAVLTGQARVVRRLICAGAFAGAQDNNGNTPLHLACREGYEEVVRHFVSPVTYEEASENKYSIPFQRLPQDLSLRNCDGHTCLHMAAQAGHVYIVEMLVEAGADINVGDGKSGRTALHFAAETNDTDMVKLLLSVKDINWSSTTYEGLTPTQLASGRRHAHIVNMIFRHAHMQHQVSWRDYSHLLYWDDDDDDDAGSTCSDTSTSSYKSHDFS